MIEAIVKAADIPLMRSTTDPFETPMPRKHALIVGGTHLLALVNLFPKYALTSTILIPTQIPEIEAEMEFRRGIQTEGIIKTLCHGVGMAKDLSGVDTDSVDLLIISTIYPSIREEFLRESWRVVRELGKVVIFTTSEIPRTYLREFGVAAPAFFPVEGFYAGVMRKAAAVRARN